MPIGWRARAGGSQEGERSAVTKCLDRLCSNCSQFPTPPSDSEGFFSSEGDMGEGGKEEKTRVCAKTHFGLGIEVSGKTASCAVPVEWSPAGLRFGVDNGLVTEHAWPS